MCFVGVFVGMCTCVCVCVCLCVCVWWLLFYTYSYNIELQKYVCVLFVKELDFDLAKFQHIRCVHECECDTIPRCTALFIVTHTLSPIHTHRNVFTLQTLLSLLWLLLIYCSVILHPFLFNFVMFAFYKSPLFYF